MVCVAICIIYCLTAEQKQRTSLYWDWYEHTKVLLVFKGGSSSTSRPSTIWWTVFFKLPYLYGLHYTVIMCVWFLVQRNHTCVVFSYKIFTHIYICFLKPYAYGLCLSMGFPDPMPIPVLYRCQGFTFKPPKTMV